VEPKHVSALLGHRPGFHKIQGIGDGFIPQVMDTSIVDDIIEVEDDDAIIVAKELAKTQGILAGISSGANIWACRKISEKVGKDKVIATILVDRAERYFSAGLFEY
jgi:cysteine synthase A